MKLIFSILILFLSLNAISQTTFPWSGTYGGTGTNRTYTTTVGGITMSATMVNSENVWQDASPKWFPTGSINPGGGCSGITATNQGMLLSTDWSNNTTKTITTTITFSSPVQGPVNFKLYDINDDGFGSWEDRIIITGTNSIAAPVNIFKVGTACVQTGGTVTGSGTPTLTFNSGQSTSCTCWGNNEINVGTATDCISTITIQYKSNVNPASYNNPKQYVVISNLTAFIPIATAPSSIIGNQSICTGQSTTLTAVGGNSSTQWYAGSCGGTLVGTGTAITVTPGSTTTYYVRNAASACVPASACIPVTVTVNPSPTMTSINSASICSGNAINLLLTSDFGTSYSWVAANNPNTSGESTSVQSNSTINNTIINNTATAQTVVYTITPSASVCAGPPQTVNVTVNPGTPPTFTAVAPICSGDLLAPLPTTSNNGFTGTWSPAINNLATTTYTFAPAAGQCATSATMIISVGPPATPTFTAVAPICSGDLLAPLPTTSNNGFTGTWSPAINNLATTTYTFAPAAGQCATSTTLTISVGPPVTPTFTTVAPICSGDLLAPLPTTSNNGFTGTWSPAINNLATTTYTFAPAAGQCATSATMIISVGPPATPTFTAVAPICSGDLLAPLPTTSNNGFTGTWSPSINNLATTTYTFAPAAGQCATSATMIISVGPPVTPTFTAVAPICSGDLLAPLPTTSNNGFTGTWSPAINNLATTTYTFAPAAGQCATSTTMTISVGPPVTPTFTAVAPICSGDLLAPLPTTSNNGFTGTWSPAINNLASTTYTFAPAAGQCATSTTMTISVGPLPIINAGLDQTICAGSTVTLFGSGALTYSWNNGITNGVLFQPSSTATYTVTGTTIEGCENTDNVTIIVNQTLPVSFTADVTDGCAPLTVTLTNTTANSSDCNWVFSNGTTLNGCGTVTTTFTQAGCYDVTLNTLFVNGCNGSQTATDLICVENAPDASFNQSANTISEFDPFIDFTNTSIGANSYSWNFGDNSAPSSEVNPSHDYSDSPEGLFQVILIAYSANGCADTAFSNFQFNEELIFYVPNTFTPDGDIFNQEFLPIFSSGYDPYDYNLAIYNRWGELIFESNNSEIGWDGSYGTNGEIVMSQDGSYTWKITFKTIRNDERKVVVGHVNLVR
jgi:gliding motility-associated-like protein